MRQEWRIKWLSMYLLNRQLCSSGSRKRLKGKFTSAVPETYQPTVAMNIPAIILDDKLQHEAGRKVLILRLTRSRRRQKTFEVWSALDSIVTPRTCRRTRAETYDSSQTLLSRFLPSSQSILDAVRPIYGGIVISYFARLRNMRPFAGRPRPSCSDSHQLPKYVCPDQALFRISRDTDL